MISQQPGRFVVLCRPWVSLFLSFYVEDSRIVVSRYDYTTPLPPWLDAKSCVHAALTTLVWDSKAGKWLC